MLNKRIVDIYTICYNKRMILPYVVHYWTQYAAKVIVYDIGSHDGSIEYLQRIPFVTVIKKQIQPGDVDSLEKLKNTIWQEAKRQRHDDFIQVSEIEEVLYEKDLVHYYNLTASLQKKNFSIAKVQYTEAISKHLPDINKDFRTVQIVKNTEFNKKILLFRPTHVVSTVFETNDITGKVEFNNDDLKITVLNMKLLGYEDRYSELMKDADAFESQSNIYYGFTDGTYKDVISMLLSHHIKEMSMAIQNNLHRNKTIKSAIHFSNYESCRDHLNIKAKKKPFNMLVNNIAWDDNNKIEYPAGHKKKSDRCIVVIPVYRHLRDDEIKNVRRTVSVLGNMYEICLVGPYALNYDYFKELFNYDFSILRCNDAYFIDTRTYSYLCETASFYESLAEYEYMLICQTDAWIFTNELEYFCNLGYDYYGGIWPVGIHVEMCGKLTEARVGNGGLSLRNVQSFIKICKSINFSQYKRRCIQSEDLLFCVNIPKVGAININIAPPEVCQYFAFDQKPEVVYKDNGNILPFGCHQKDNPFNKPFYDSLSDIDELQVFSPSILEKLKENNKK